jgi:hypothetical protein
MRVRLLVAIILLAALSAFAARGYDSPDQTIFSYDTTNFRIWWTTAGQHQITDPVDDDGDDVPDRLETLGDYLEYCLDSLVGDGWDEPLRDGDWYPSGYDYGGDERIDVYIQNVDVAYGADYYFTAPELTYDDTVEDDAATYIGFTREPFDDIGIIRTAVAEAVARSVFYGIDYDESSHFVAKSATWVAEQLYPNVNDYQEGSVTNYLIHPDEAMTSDTSPLFAMYLDSLARQNDTLGQLVTDGGYSDVIQLLWLGYAKRTAAEDLNFNEFIHELWVDAFGGPYDPVTTGLGAAYTEYARWNWFTNLRSAQRGGNGDNNFGYYYYDDDNPAEGDDAVAYPEVNYNDPVDTREWTGADIASGIQVDFVADYNPPDGLGAVYIHAVDLGSLDDVVFAYKAYTDNADATKYWDGLYVLMDDEDTVHSSQTDDPSQMAMAAFADKGIIRVSDASTYDNIAFIPHLIVDEGDNLGFQYRLWQDSSGDTTPPSFEPADGGALCLAQAPGFNTHFEFIATPNEYLFCCPRYDIDFTDEDGELHRFTVNGNQQGDVSFDEWDDGLAVYTAQWVLPTGFYGTADVSVTAADLVGNVTEMNYSGFLATADIDEDGGAVGREDNAVLEIPADAYTGGRVTVLMRPDVSGGLLESRALRNAPASGGHASAPALSRAVSRRPGAPALGETAETGRLGLHVVGRAYDLSGSGVLTGSATLRLVYSDRGVDNEDLLGLYRFDANSERWNRVAAQFDRQADEVYAAVDEFGLYAVGYTEYVEIDEPGHDPRPVFALEQNYPNPYVAGDRTTIGFSLVQSGSVRLDVYDISGRLVTTLVDETLPAGRHDISWNGCTTAGRLAEPGVYFYKLETESNSATRRMVLVR